MDALYIPAETQIEGPITIARSVWVEGTVEGDIRTEEELVLTETGTVRGMVRARSADVGGVIEGGITVSGQLVLEQSARIRGDIAADHLILEEGAQFSGDCRMREPGTDVEIPDFSTSSARGHSEEEIVFGTELGT